MIEAAIFDYGRTLHDPEMDRLYPESRKVLGQLKEMGLKLGLVSRGKNIERRYQDFKRFDLESYFELIQVVGQEGKKEFEPFIDDLGIKDCSKVAIVGDRVKSEILEGNKLGCITIWLRRGKFRDELAENIDEEPDFIIYSLTEIVPILRSI